MCLTVLCWLYAQVDEVAAVRKGLLALRQNVLLLQDDSDPDKFYPRWVAPRPKVGAVHLGSFG
jgi:hypothetical protein